MLTEVKHLVVHRAFRKVGLGKKLIENAMAVVDTPILYATIRSKNTASLRLFQAAGFHIASTAKMKDHETHFLIKENEAHLKISAVDKKQPQRTSFSGVSFGGS